MGICPKTFAPCCDDFCRVTCFLMPGVDVLNRCDYCGKTIYEDEYVCPCRDEDDDRSEFYEDEFDD
jgi:hypothetical protein